MFFCLKGLYLNKFKTFKMKKVYLGALAFVCTLSSVNAQVAQKPVGFNGLERNFRPVAQVPGETNKALGIEIYSNDFDNPADWTIDNDGQTDAAFGWSIDAVSDGWWSPDGISSTSGGNFAELSNGNGQTGTQEFGVEYILTLANPIDIANLPLNTANSEQVNLQFEQFGALFNDEQLVQISTDGGANWITVRDNRDYYDVLSASGGAPYPDPDLISINLAPYIVGNSSNFSLRFKWTTAFPQFPTNANVWITYGWYIDDIKLVTNPDNDLETANPYWGARGLNYYQIPNTQVHPLDFAVDAINNGVNAQTGATLSVDFTGAGTGSASSTGITVAPNTTGSLEIEGGFTPSVNGTYTFTWEISQDQVDDVPGNNVLTGDAFQVVNNIYARDRGTTFGTFNNAGIGYKLGNLYDMYADQIVYGVQTRLSNTSNTGAQFQAKLYWLPTNAATLDDMVQVAFSDYIDVAPGNVNTILNIPFIDEVMLDADSTYYVAIESVGDAGATNDVVVSTSGSTYEQTSFLYDAADDEWYFTTNTPVIRMNFDQVLSVKEVENNIALSVYPNPANDFAVVSFANADNSTVKIVDIAGKVVATLNANAASNGSTKLNVNTSNFEAGVYTVIVEHSTGVSSTKFIKK